MNRATNHTLFIGLGFVVWLTFLIFIRLIGDTVFETNSPILAAFFIGSYPILYVTLVFLSRLTQVPMAEMFVPVVVMTFTALTFDGIAIGFTDFYGETDNQVRAAAAYLLFGAAGGMIVAFLVGRGHEHRI